MPLCLLVLSSFVSWLGGNLVEVLCFSAARNSAGTRCELEVSSSICCKARLSCSNLIFPCGKRERQFRMCFTVVAANSRTYAQKKTCPTEANQLFQWRYLCCLWKVCGPPLHIVIKRVVCSHFGQGETMVNAGSLWQWIWRDLKSSIHQYTILIWPHNVFNGALRSAGNQWARGNGQPKVTFVTSKVDVHHDVPWMWKSFENRNILSSWGPLQTFFCHLAFPKFPAAPWTPWSLHIQTGWDGWWSTEMA